jgi:secreted trypsin-like serine protease
MLSPRARSARGRRRSAAIAVCALALGPAVAAPARAVVGGTAAAPGAYPFMVSLRENGYLYCGGTLIAAQWVLTAAHCADGRSPATLEAVVDQPDLSTPDGQDRLIDQIIVDPSYNSASEDDDVALLHLAAPVTGIAPAELIASGDDSADAPGTVATVIGFGSTLPETVDGGGAVSYPAQLEQTEVAVDTARQCSSVFNGGGQPAIDNSVMLCAGGDGRHDACVGDSGGPLLVPDGDGWIDVGITSWGAGCAVRGVPGVYTRLSDPAIASFVAATAGG